MPPAPEVSLLTRYLFENPWPLGGLLVLAGALLAWIGLRDGRFDRLRQSLLLLVPGIAVFVIAAIVETSGERARGVARSLVDAVVAGDSVAVMGTFAPDATMHVGSPTNPGQNVDVIRSAVSWFAGRFTISRNTVTALRGYSESADAATVHLACWTETSGFGGGASQWVLRVERIPDPAEPGGEAWRITRMTFVSLNGQPPPMPSGFR